MVFYFEIFAESFLCAPWLGTFYSGAPLPKKSFCEIFFGSPICVKTFRFFYVRPSTYALGQIVSEDRRVRLKKEQFSSRNDRYSVAKRGANRIHINIYCFLLLTSLTGAAKKKYENDTKYRLHTSFLLPFWAFRGCFSENQPFTAVRLLAGRLFLFPSVNAIVKFMGYR